MVEPCFFRLGYTHVSITFNNRPAILGTPSLVCLLMLDNLNFKISLKNMGVPAIFKESYDVKGDDVILY